MKNKDEEILDIFNFNLKLIKLLRKMIKEVGDIYEK